MATTYITLSDFGGQQRKQPNIYHEPGETKQQKVL